MKAQFLSLDSNVWPFNLAQTNLIANLKTRGIDVSRVYCKGNLIGACIPLGEMEQSRKLTVSELNALCKACQKRTILVEKQNGLSGVFLDDYFDRVLYDEYLVSSKNLDTSNWHAFKIDGLGIGRIAAYEFFLKYKLNELVIPGHLFSEYRSSLDSTLKVLASSTNALNDSKPDVLISYNSLYSLNSAYSQVAEKMGISPYSIQYGSHIVERLETLSIFRSTRDLISVPFSANWQSKSLSPLTVTAVDKSVDHFFGLTKGDSPWAYSSKITNLDAKKALGIVNENPCVLAITSSEDEIFAAKMVGALPDSPYVDSFPTQKDFILAIYAAAQLKPDWNFILRMHPRLMPNKRDSRTSNAVNDLDTLFQTKPNNVYVNKPTDNVSIYDLFSKVDAGVNYRSSSGYELLACGIPVVTCISKDYFPGPTDGLLIVDNHVELVDRLQAALEGGPKIQYAIPVFKWWGYLFENCCRRISEQPAISVTHFSPKKNLRFIRAWRFLTKVIQLRLPMIRERLDLRSVGNFEIGNHFFEVITGGLTGISDCEVEEKAVEDVGLVECAFAVNKIREHIGLPQITK